MIIYKINDIKTYETNSDFPNTDWTGQAEFIIDETDEKNNELILKIKEFTPYFDYVLDDKGNLIDVIKIENETQQDDYIPELEIMDPINTLQTKCDELENQNKQLLELIETLSKQLNLQEECIVEMAQIVYA